MSVRPCNPPDDEDPIESLSTILARAVARLWQRDIRDAQLPPESGVSGLALCGESRPSVVDGPESRRKDE
jgi:hypothetical protein